VQCGVQLSQRVGYQRVGEGASVIRRATTHPTIGRVRQGIGVQPAGHYGVDDLVRHVRVRLGGRGEATASSPQWSSRKAERPHCR
jgi:hypothetical protein